MSAVQTYMKHLTVIGRLGWCFQNKCASFSSKRENTVPHWAFKWSIALAATENGHIKGCVLNLKCHKFCAAVFYAVANFTQSINI